MPPELTPTPSPTPTPELTPSPVDHSVELAALKAELAALKAAKVTDEPDLITKAKAVRDAEEQSAGNTKRLESSITFNMKLPEFIKQSGSLLSKDISDIVAAADRETYSSAVEKTDAIKSGVVQSFFSVQANVDLLTPGQKSMLDEYLKLTKTGKQDKASALYEIVFEPAFEMLKRTKKAEALNKGFANEGDAEQAYKNRLIANSRKHYGLGENK